MSKFKIGDRVMHTFTPIFGEVVGINSDRNSKYVYRVEWENRKEDTYDPKVLKPAPTNQANKDKSL